MASDEAHPEMSQEATDLNRAELRIRMRAARREVPPEERARAEAAVAESVSSFLESPALTSRLHADAAPTETAPSDAAPYESAAAVSERLDRSDSASDPGRGRTPRIGIYIPADGEISPLSIGTAVVHRGWSTWLPIVLPDGHLTFAHWKDGDSLAKNRFGIGEPAGSAQRCSALELDVVVIPSVALDRQGNRTGMGAGFYDRAFSELDGTRRGDQPVLIGLAFELQIVESIPTRAWDVRLDVVATEQALTLTHARSVADNSEG